MLVLVACGGRSSAPAHPETPPRASKEGATSRSDQHCDKLIAHTLSLAVAERPAEQKLTPDERTNIEAQLRKTWRASCKQMTTTGYDCALAAQSLAEVDTCASNKAQ